MNFDVKRMLIDEVHSGCPGKYSERQISRMLHCKYFTNFNLWSLVAVQRMYENQRRQYLNQRPERAHKAQEQDLKKKFSSRRERVRYVTAIYL